jgi:hypothetical protein
MNALTLEFLRFGATDFGILREGDAYLCTAGNAPATQVKAPVHHHEFLDWINALRYAESEDERRNALLAAQDVATRMLGVDLGRLQGLTQLDLVLSPAELSILPFECALNDAKEPLFLDNRGPFVITRRFRHGFAGQSRSLPAKPRVLLISASPPSAGKPVPLDQHKQALRVALKPWIEPLEGFEEAVPDERSVLTIVSNASLGRIKAVLSGLEKEANPVTAIHILAHGCPIGTGHRDRYGLALHSTDDSAPYDAVAPEALVECLAPVLESCFTVTLAVCDSGNELNTIIPEKSIAHEFHKRVPVVIASQFPLTFSGSVALVEEFYSGLLSGEDVRKALNNVRCRMYEETDSTFHDWMSLVGYIELPEGYYDHLDKVRAENELAALKTAQAWADRLIGNGKARLGDYDNVVDTLRRRIERLGHYRSSVPQSNVASLQESLGLRGSAYKRLAEILFYRSKISHNKDADLHESKDALKAGLKCYQEAYAHNISHHWTGVQALSLEAILTGKLQRAGRWHATLESALLACESETEIWAFGTIAEVLLLAPYAEQAPDMPQAKRALEKMRARVADLGKGNFPLESTKRQLNRYVEWWTTENSFFAGLGGVADDARTLASLLA